MAYSKTTWVDRNVQFPNRYDKTLETSLSVTLAPNAGTVTAVGTSISATNMNKIEQGIYEATNIPIDTYITFGGRFKIGYNSSTDTLDIYEI